MFLLRSIVTALALVTCSLGHAEPDTPFANHPVEVSRRQLETNKRHALARKCAAEVAAYQRERKLRRARKVRRQEETSTTSAPAPHYSTIQNFTCVGAPEVTEGPYYLRDEYVRQDLREDQTGTDLYLDIGVMDITTCQPAQNVFVEIWACSAQGVYSGFGGAFPGGGGGDGSSSFSFPFPTGFPTGFPTESGSFSFPIPTDFPGGFNVPKTASTNFLRGGVMANENGVAELLTKYPGFYTGRTVHIHTMIHQDIEYHSNGTIISSSGGLRHIGQIFFDEATNQEVLAQAEYQDTGNSRTYNNQDGILAQANEGGHSAFAEVEKLGDGLEDGLLGYITIGIDSSASRTISTTNYWDPNFNPAIANGD